MPVDSISVSCFSPIVTINPKYRKDAYSDSRFRRLGPQMYSDWYLSVPCGKCYLCRKKRANSWRIRLIEECKTLERFYYEGKYVFNALFLTFTYRDDVLPPSKRDEIAVHLRKWRDLWRKKYGRSPRYFATTDKGSQFGRLHLHLIIFQPYDYKRNRRVEWQELSLYDFFWRYGFAYIDKNRPYLEDLSGVTYVTSYITGGNLEKDAQKHGKPICEESKHYIPYIFVSRGLGAYFLTYSEVYSRYMSGDTTYRVSAFDYALPLYYRNKIFDCEMRYWMRVDHKEELQRYFKYNADNLRWKLSGTYYRSVEDVERVYYDVYAQFDKIKKFNINA